MRKIEKIMISNNTMEKKDFFAPLSKGLGATRRAACVLITLVMAFAGVQTAFAAVGDVVDSGTCGTNLTWTLTDNGGTVTLSDGDYSALTLTITGTGAMYDYTSSTRPWGIADNIRYRITTLNLPEGITHIGDYAFYFTNYSGPLVIPSTVKTIGAFGFYCFNGATSVTIPASVTSIGESGLWNFGKNASSCTVTFAEGSQLSSIGARAFYGVGSNLDLRPCSKLTAITAEEVFRAYTKIVTFPKTLTSVCANAFKGSNEPTVKLSYQGFLVINNEYQSYNANGAVRTITSKFSITIAGSKAVTIYQGTIDGLTWNTDGSYYEITDEQDLIDLGLYVIDDEANTCAGLTFKMTADLDFTKMPDDCHGKNGMGGGNFLPIGLSGKTLLGGARFAGSFYGQGHSITGLRYDYAISGLSLFSCIENGAVVDGVTVVSPSFKASGSVGGIVGMLAAGTVRNCAVVNGSIDALSNSHVGGIVGYSNSGTNIVSGCTVVGTTVSGEAHVGIIVGMNNAALTIGNCTYHTPSNLPVCGVSEDYTDGGGNQRVYQLTLADGATTNTAPAFSYGGTDYYAGTITLAAAPTGWVYEYSVNGSPISGNTFDISADATVALSRTPDPAHFSVNGDGSYTIHTATGWNVFCDCLDDNDTYNRFSGKTVKLGNDIGTAQDPITRMAGSSKHDFCGTFDGDGHTLTVNISSDGITDGSTQYVAPFRYVSNTKANPSDEADSPAAIRNLHVTGTITTDKQFTGGLIGGCWGNVSIENCAVSTAINSTIDGAGGHGGIVGIHSSGTLTITGCVFDGSLLGTTTHSVGGFLGYRKSGAEIRNSLFIPAEVTVLNTSGATFARNKVDTYNSYYTYYLCDGTNYAPYDPADVDHPDKYNNGHMRRTITAGDNVTIDAIALTGDATEYNVSGITAYSGGGLKLGDVKYYGSGDQVSLTLSNTTTGAPEGYTNGGYTASAGTLSGTENPYTLTMPDEDVTITVGLSPIDWANVNQGTSADPYMIYNKDQLDLLAHRVNGTHGETRQEDGYSGKYFKLANDINYPHTSDWNNFTSDENNFEAIGGDSNNCHFRGHFDGNNKTISGIRIYKGDKGIADDYKGIFGRTANGADIHDLTLADARITGHLDIGGIVGYNNKSTVNRCHVAANVAICAVQPTVSSLGGIVGVNDRGTIENCISAATLTVADADNSNFYGGIAGTNRQYSTLHDNLVIGATVPAVTANNYGAITGYNDRSTLQRNYYTACKVADVENATGVGSCNADVTDGAVPGYLLTLGEGITSTALSITIPEHKELNSSGQLVTVAAVTYNVAAAGTTVWFNSGETEGYSTSYIVDGSPVSGNSITMPAAPVTVTSNDNEHIDLWGIDGGADGSSEHPYIITTTAGWIHLAGNVAAGKSYSDKYFQLGAGISISTMVGTSDHPFSGHFNGNGNTLDIDIISVGEYTAPFRYVSGATITGLHTTGTVTTSHKFATGLVGRHDGDVTISDCRSSVTIASIVSDDGTHGGFAATGSGTVTIEGCLFDGVICCNIAKLTNKCAGFVGWRSGTVNISNSLYAPAAVPEGKYAIKTDGSATFARNGADITNCYYTQTLGDAQGKACHSITAGENVTIDGLGAGTEYSVSGITAYPTGIKYNDVYYAGSGDQVSLTLSHGDKAGYAFNEYTATAGTLSGEENPYTLTMPDADVTINTALRSDGQSHDITYIDADGTEKIASAIALDGTENSLGQNGQDTWYFVGNDFSHSGTINCYGDVNLILCDGETMTVTNTGTGNEDFAIYGDSGSLHIYGQSQGTGALTATANSSVAIKVDDYITISGGTVTATSTSDVGIYGIDGVTINGGTVNANGIYSDGDVTINGGKVTATATGNSGICSNSGTIILGLSNATDYITAESYSAYLGIIVKAGQTLTDGTNTYSGTLTDDQKTAIAEKTLQPCLALADNADNTAAIRAHKGQAFAVALQGRTLYKDGDWNTLCLPFDVSTTSGPLAGDNVVAMTLNTSESNLTGSTLTLNFDAAPTTIPAGTPFIIKWGEQEEKTGYLGTIIENPVFTGVTIDNTDRSVTSSDGYVTFKGTYSPIVWNTENKSILFVGTNNTLYWPTAGGHVNACRAYFDLGSASAREFVMNFDGENEVTSLPQPLQKEGSQADAWYTLDGRKLNGKPTTKGLYIHNGKKVIIK